MSQKPIMRNSVETGLDVPFQNPLRIGFGQCFETLFHCIGAETHTSCGQRWFPPRDRVPADTVPVGLDLSWWG